MSFVVTWVLLAGLWWGLSGYTDVIHLTFGAVAVTLVSFLSHKHLAAAPTSLGRAWRTVLYLPWLFWQIIVANVDVALRVLGIRAVDPRMIRFKADLDTEYGLTLLANSITLTPGTVTVEAREDGEFIVHALTPGAAEGVLSRDMERRVRWVDGSAGDAPATQEGA